MGKRIVIALGGNALGKSPSEQLELVKITSKHIVDLVEAGNDVIVTHGNGPQVGMINLAMENAHSAGAPEMPFAECGAMSQGYIGYHLQQSLQLELAKRGLNRGCATVITQVEVDEKDKAFENPTKPIGAFYSKEEAEKIASEKGCQVKEDAGRGYRRVIASPLPLNIVELGTISELFKSGNIVIACGGGGIPVTYNNETGEYRGIDAVIDKDRTSAKMAGDLKADLLIILTAVDKVAIKFGTPDQIELSQMTIEEAEGYIADGEFAPGSMLPKVEACLEFVKNSNGKAIITSLDKAKDALNGENGTVIVREGGN